MMVFEIISGLIFYALIGVYMAGRMNCPLDDDYGWGIFIIIFWPILICYWPVILICRLFMKIWKIGNSHRSK